MYAVLTADLLFSVETILRLMLLTITITFPTQILKYCIYHTVLYSYVIIQTESEQVQLRHIMQTKSALFYKRVFECLFFA